MIPSRVCTICKIDKPLNDYCKQTAAKDGLHQMCKTCTRGYTAAHYVKHAAKYSRAAKSHYVNRAYGITIEQYETLMASKTACEICDKPVEGARKSLDHNHQTMEIRGVLCGSCNRGLGLFGDCPEKLLKASRYLHDRGDYSELLNGSETSSP